jgi:hypothetical protein
MEDEKESAILEMAAFCGCGCPEEAMRFVCSFLDIFDPDNPDDRWLDDTFKALHSYFQNEGAAYFFYYWMDSRGFSEHGGSVPGWITEKGKRFHVMLREYLSEAPAQATGANPTP